MLKVESLLPALTEDLIDTDDVNVTIFIIDVLQAAFNHPLTDTELPSLHIALTDKTDPQSEPP